ncbi:hypothetical protein HK102_001053, partial [Quaeritorhiza haematococci]
GIRLDAYKPTQKFTFINAQHVLHQDLDTTNTAFLSPAPLTQILDSIQTAVTATSTGAGGKRCRTCIVVDDISGLVYAGYEVRQVVRFVAACKALAEQSGGFLVVSMHADEYDNGTTLPSFVNGAGTGFVPQKDVDLDRVRDYLEHVADTRVMVSGVGAGRARGITGQLTVARRDYPSLLDPNAAAELAPRTLQFKLEDSGVQFFAVGYSRDFL